MHRTYEKCGAGGMGADYAYKRGALCAVATFYNEAHSGAGQG